MKISNWSLLGYVGGAIYAIGSFWRYFVIYQDLSQDILGVSIGLMVMSLAFLYNRQVEQGNSIKAIEAYLSDKNFDEKYKGEAE